MTALSRRTLTLSFLFTLPYALALLTFAWLGSYSRIIADDYCTAMIGNSYGVFGTVKYFYENWSGAHTAFAIFAALAPYEPGVHIILTGSILLLWWLALVWLIHEIGRLLNVTHKLLAALMLATVALYAVVSTMPSDEALYWFASLLSYTLPCVIVTFYACIILFLMRQKHSTVLRIVGIIVSGLIGFAVGGIAETVAVFQILVLTLMIVGVWFVMPDEKRQGLLPASSRKRTLLLILLVGMLVTGISLLIDIIAPGNDVRMAEVIKAKDFTSGDIFPPLLILLSYAFAIQETITPAAVLASLTVFFTAAYLAYWLIPSESTFPWRRVQRYFNLSIPVAWSIVAVVIAVPLYGIAHPSPRSLVVVRFAEIILVAWWGWLAGQTLQRRGALQARIRNLAGQRLPVVIVLIMLIAIPLNTLRTNLLDLLPAFSAYAADWDARHALIQGAISSGATTVDVPVEPTYLEDYFKLDDLSVWGGCASEFYGIDLNVTGISPKTEAPEDTPGISPALPETATDEPAATSEPAPDVTPNN